MCHLCSFRAGMQRQCQIFFVEVVGGSNAYKRLDGGPFGRAGVISSALYCLYGLVTSPRTVHRALRNSIFPLPLRL